MQWTPYTLPVLLSGLTVTAAGAFILKRRRETPAATEFLVLVFAMASNAVLYALELSATSLDAQLWLLSARYVAICAMPGAHLVFALRWGGHDGWRTPGRLAVLAGVPIVFLGLAWTNEWHHWVASSSGFVSRDGFVMRHAETHWALWLFVLYAYGGLMVSTGIYLRAIYASPLHRSQGAMLLVATFFPWVANALFMTGRSPDPDLDVSPFGYACTAVVWAFALSRTRFLDIAPIARGQVFDGLADAVIVVGPHGRTIDWNPAAAALFGRRAADGIGLPVAELLGEGAARRIVAGDRALELAILGRTLALDCAPLRREDQLLASILTLRDVSEQQRIAAAREEALRLAETVARTRSEFLARMSHEVRSPLHAISGAADLLMTAELAAPERRYASAIASSSRALLAVVDDLLDLSKLDADRMRVAPSDLDVLDALREVAELFAGAADRKGVTLTVVGQEPLPVRADAARLRQVLVNLVGNALKFTGRGSITLRAHALGDRTRIEVVDTGAGIPEHARSRIFEPFVQVDTVGGAVPSGTGLGLAIARRLLTLMGGEIGVESRVGHGSTFWLTVPTATASATSAAAPRHGASRSTTSEGSRGRVLVVDDSEVNRFITGAILEREGCEVDAMASADEALAALGSASTAARPYALVITDLRMPRMDGFELAAALRARADATPIVALTADVYAGAELRARGSGMQGWLAKPIEPARLRELLDRLAPARTPRPGPMSVLDVLGSSPELHARVMRAFLASTPRELAAIDEAAREERWDAVRAHAHALQGPASMVGARELAEACRALTGRGAPTRSAVQKLSTAYAAFLAAPPVPAAPGEDAGEVRA